MASISAIDHVEVVQNGKVIATARLGKGSRSGRGAGIIPVKKSGGVVLRAWDRNAQPEVLDIYPYATTTPIYVTVSGVPQRAPEDAQYMLDWLDLIEKVAQRAEYNTREESAEVLRIIAQARVI